MSENRNERNDLSFAGVGCWHNRMAGDTDNGETYERTHDMTITNAIGEELRYCKDPACRQANPQPLEQFALTKGEARYKICRACLHERRSPGQKAAAERKRLEDTEALTRCEHKHWIFGWLAVEERWPGFYEAHEPELGQEWQICADCGFAKLVDLPSGKQLRAFQIKGGFLRGVSADVGVGSNGHTGERVQLTTVARPQAPAPAPAPQPEPEAQDPLVVRFEREGSPPAADWNVSDAKGVKDGIGVLMEALAAANEAVARETQRVMEVEGQLREARLKLELAACRKFSAELLVENAQLRGRLEGENV